MSLETLNPLRLDRLADGPDALPVGKPHTQKPYTGPNRDIGLGFDVASEVYRVRNSPELFDDWHRDLVENCRVVEVDRLNTALLTSLTPEARLLRAIWGEGPDPIAVYDWDCHGCKMAVLTHEITDPCPNCSRIVAS